MYFLSFLLFNVCDVLNVKYFMNFLFLGYLLKITHTFLKTPLLLGCNSVFIFGIIWMTSICLELDTWSNRKDSRDELVPTPNFTNEDGDLGRLNTYSVLGPFPSSGLLCSSFVYDFPVVRVIQPYPRHSLCRIFNCTNCSKSDLRNWISFPFVVQEYLLCFLFQLLYSLKHSGTESNHNSYVHH